MIQTSSLAPEPGLALRAGEVVRCRFESDLNPQRQFAPQLVLVTDQRIARRAGKDWTFVDLADGLDFVRHETPHLGRLEWLRGDQTQLLVEYTHAKSAEAGEFARALEGAEHGRSESEIDEPLPPPLGASTKRRLPPLFRLLSFSRPHLRPIALGLFLTIGTTAAGLVPPYLTMPIVDRVLLPSQSGNAPANAHGLLLYYLSGLALAAAISWVLAWAQGYLLARVGERISADLRNRTYAHLQRLSLEYFGGKRTGDLIARIGNDTEHLCSFLSDTLIDFVTDILMITGSAAVLLVLDPTLALAALLSFPPIAWLIVTLRSRLTTGFLRGGRVWSAMTSILADTIPGIRVVKAFSQERRETERFALANRRIVAVNDRVNRLWTFFWPSVGFLNQLGLLVVWIVGATAVLGHHATVGVLTAFIAYISRFYTRVESMSRMLTASQRAAAGAERLFEILDREPSVADPPQPTRITEFRGSVEFRQVGFRYGTRRVLEDIQLTLRPGEMLGVVGHTGSGKSTLANLLCRFYDVSSGAVLVDGVDIRQLSLEEYRKHIGVVLQESFLFFGTVADNISYGKSAASCEEILAAARSARAHDFVLRQPEGYDSMVGERGQALSGGERQRLAIARALLVKPQILVLDEATSAVDSETEREIQRALEAVVRGRTTLAIAHRLSTLRRADRIAVLRLGRVVELGSHDELLALDGEYAKLWRAQSSGPGLEAAATESLAPPELSSLSRVTLLAGRQGELQLSAAELVAPRRVTPVRCFPWSAPDLHVTLLDEHGRELHHIDRPDTLPPSELTLLRQALDQREFVPQISTIFSLTTRAGFSDWHVATDRGPCHFRLDQHDHVRELDSHRLLLTDATGSRFVIRDRTALDRRSRHLLTRFC